MNITAIFWLQKAKALADGAWGLACVTCTVSLCGLGVWWSVQGGTFANVTNTNAPHLYVATGESTEVPSASTITLAAESRKVVYQMSLVDKAGEVVYKYPRTDNVSGTSDPDAGNMTISVPPEVPSGDYQLYVDVEYAANPLKENRLRIEMAKITVDSK